MSVGLAALLDDVAAIAKVAAASLDDVTAAAGKASAKAVGVVVDDTAVTPGYAVGFTPDRELPIVWKIALGSLRNKFLFLLPGALVLSAFAPWLVTPILMLGGAYLCYEATEKCLEAFVTHEEVDQPAEFAQGSADVEKEKVSGAIRTDLILSAEIMAISLSSVANQPLPIQAFALAAVGLLLTVAVYGVVGFIVKMDDIGLHYAVSGNRGLRVLGRGLVKGMPWLLEALTVVGTAAMLWVGGGILVHGMEHYHVPLVTEAFHGLRAWAGGVPMIGGFTSWLAFAAGSAVVGLIVGGVVVGALHMAPRKGHGKAEPPAEA